ncbi:TPA: hypothetical protein N0F65_002914 [Lagenidium giganteum]|uniref:AB hydrolase-1 domain-containing protein n=1 Tax=Lagenidium giganteum TaxID=4803 RepID=A0AAV2Z367_9STRA|nr:TPA: hypothetical protein N0F65_002914 [Lagenidium giganteum]
MTRISTLLAIAASATLVVATPAVAHQSTSPWTGCNDAATLIDPAANDLECAMIKMPLCHKGVCQSKQTIELFTQRLLAKHNPDSKPNVWLLSGGPGQNSNFASFMIELRRMSNDSINLYTLDHRGTVLSAYLSCGDDIEYTGYGDCFRKLLAQFDNKPEAFSVTSAATDVALLATKFASKAESYVYGISYGTYLTERVMHLAPNVVKGYVLDGVAADRSYPFTFMSNDMIPVSKRLAEACEENAYCRSKFEKEIAEHGSLNEAFINIVHGFDKSPNRCIDFIVQSRNGNETSNDTSSESGNRVSASQTVKQLLVDLISEQKRVLIPAYLYRIHRCNDNDMAFLQAFPVSSDSTGTSGSSHGGSDDADKDSKVPVTHSNSPFLYKVIVYSEMWQHPTPTAKKLNENATTTYLWQDSTDGVKEYCLVTGRHDEPACQDPAMNDIKNLYNSTPAFAYEPDRYSMEVATISDDVGVMVFGGGLDFQTPWEYSRLQYGDMKTTNKLMVEVKHGAHGNALWPVTSEDETQCGHNIFLSFVTNKANVRKVDTSCLKNVPAIQFNNPATAAELLGGALEGDAFEGTAQSVA